MNEIKEMMDTMDGMTQKDVCELMEVPKRTFEDWCMNGIKKNYLKKLVIEKMESIRCTREAGVKILNKAKELNEYESYLPDLQVGDIVEMNDLWDGNRDVPEESFSIPLNDLEWINYKFKILEEKENGLGTIIQITNIELL